MTTTKPASPNTTDADSKRETVLTQMNDQLRKVAEKVMAELTDMRKAIAFKLWHLGADLRKIQEKADKYGDNAIGLLEEYVGIELPDSRSYIQKALQINRIWTEGELKALLALRTKKHNKPISWQHIERLMIVKDDKQRDSLIDDIVEKDMTVQDLDYAIDPNRVIQPNGNGNGAKHSGGRPRVIPESVVGRLTEINKVAGNVARDHKIFWNDKSLGVERLAKEVPADKIDHKLIELVDVTLSTLEEAEEACKVTKVKLETTKKELQTRMAAQAKLESGKAVKAINRKTKDKVPF